jgi:ribosomal protein S18 acetylase RimI-like enzyme
VAYGIRQMQPRDLVDVVRLSNQAFRETARHTWRMCQRFADRMRGDREALFVAEAEDGTVVGFSIGQCEGDRASLSWIAVHPDHSGRGVGGMLLGALENRAREKGIPVVQTGTPFARPFYEKHGYRCVGVRRSLLLELVGTAVPLPRGIRVRPTQLDDLSATLGLFEDEEEWFRFVEAHAGASERNPDLSLSAESDSDRRDLLGIAVGRKNTTCEELIALTYLHAFDGPRAQDILDAFAYACSCRGHRWLGIGLPLPGVGEEALRSRGWQDAKLPFYCTSYTMQKVL